MKVNGIEVTIEHCKCGGHFELCSNKEEKVIAAICPNCGYGFIFDVIQFAEVQSES